MVGTFFYSVHIRKLILERVIISRLFDDWIKTYLTKKKDVNNMNMCRVMYFRHIVIVLRSSVEISVVHHMYTSESEFSELVSNPAAL